MMRYTPPEGNILLMILPNTLTPEKALIPGYRS
jgi:hypothetical protein